ncbi:glycosyltransferase family 4 protein [Haliscomenobacter sp.]|uniref:glycosyltransferase family 4 protein n=1 Tax=Haliscomenobacter sp. TaxID=2717303 RepID=UPI003BAA08C9
MQPLLILSDWFFPGYRAGGPIQSAYNFAIAMRAHYPIKVLTTDRDLEAAVPYAGVVPECWQPFEGTEVEVLYTAAPALSARRILRYLRQVQPQYLYLNSMFSLYFTLLPLLFFRLGWIKTQVVLAPRGMLKASALQFKTRKKQLFLQLFRWSGLPQSVVFHASDAQEKKDIERIFGSRCKIVVVPDFPAPVLPLAQPKGKNTVARFLLLGRIHPIKNVHLAIAQFRECPVPAELAIIGSNEDAAYWQQCAALLADLPAHLQVHYRGELPHPQVRALLPEYDFLLLPTQGENFGHAIFEAFAAGLPVIISDQTPWKDLQNQQIGWDLPLDQPAGFAEAIAQAARMSQEQYAQWSAQAQAFAQGFVEKAGLKAAYLHLFS